MYERVFFIFSERESKLLFSLIKKKSFRNKNQIKLIVSLKPGLDLDIFRKYSVIMNYEDILKFCNLNEKKASYKAFNYAKDILNCEKFKKIFRDIDLNELDCIKKALKNQLAWITRNSFLFSSILEVLIEKKMEFAMSFNGIGGFQIMDTFPTNFLIDNNIFYKNHLESVSKSSNIKFISFKKITLGGFMFLVRTWLLFFFRFIVMSHRSIKFRSVKNKYKIKGIHFIRAEAEFHASEPLIKALIKKNESYCYFADNLIQKDNCLKFLKNRDYKFFKLHSFTSWFDILKIFIKTLIISNKLIYTKNNNFLSDYLTQKYGFLGNNEIINNILFYLIINHLPEIYIHKKQILKVFKKFKPDYVVSYDQIDKYGAIEGCLAKQNNIRSTMIQTASIFDFYYPFPLSMDNMIVDTKNTKRILVSSGAEKEKIHNLGLPMMEEIICIGNNKVNSLKSDSSDLSILITTQPFISSKVLNYNFLMIKDVISAINKNFKKVKIIIKIHPRESLKQYRVIKSVYEDQCSITLNDGKFEDIIEKVDLVISRTSTTIQTSILYGVPAISYLDKFPSDIIEGIFYIKSKASFKCFNKNELNNLINKFLSKKTKELLYQQFKKERKYFIGEAFPIKNSLNKTIEILKKI